MTSCDRGTEKDSPGHSTKVASSHCRQDRPVGVASWWEELSPGGKMTAAGLIALDLGLLAAAWHFLYHLPASRIRGKKAAWCVLTLVDFLGPLTFLLCGIKREVRS